MLVTYIFYINYTLICSLEQLIANFRLKYRSQVALHLCVCLTAKIDMIK